MTLSLVALTSILAAAPQLVGLVNNTVVEVEQMIGTLPGASKLAAAEAKLGVYLNDAVQDTETLANLTSVVPTLINAAVSMFNAAKVFTSKTVVAAAAPAATA